MLLNVKLTIGEGRFFLINVGFERGLNCDPSKRAEMTASRPEQDNELYWTNDIPSIVPELEFQSNKVSITTNDVENVRRSLPIRRLHSGGKGATRMRRIYRAAWRTASLTPRLSTASS